jgi:hypothetical protein
MIAEIPRFIWADTRFIADKRDPLKYRALTKSYDHSTHTQHPFVYDLDFGLTGVNPCTARALVGMSEISMLSLPNLLAVVSEASSDNPRPGIRLRQTASEVVADVLGVQKSQVVSFGLLDGLLTGALLEGVVKPDYRNAVKILDLHTKDTSGADIAGKFTGFFTTSRKVVLSRAQQLYTGLDSDIYQTDNEGNLTEASCLIVKDHILIEGRKVGHLRVYRNMEVDSGFVAVAERLIKFADAVASVRPSWAVRRPEGFDDKFFEEIWKLYYSEVASGMRFLSGSGTSLDHEKFLSHEHALVGSDSVKDTGCIVDAGNDTVTTPCLSTEVADLEKAGRCPFFTSRGWVDTFVKASVVGL